MKLKSICLMMVVIGLGACATPEPVVVEEPVVLEIPPLMQQKRMGKIDKEMLFSNQSVIFYPLDKAPGDVTRSFPEYRGVLENTTAGGYTVFDPSVTVYAVESGQTRPSYLPEYSVPQHAGQYRANMMREEQAAIAAIPPMPLTPRTLTSPPEQTMANNANPIETPRPPRTLTAY